MPGMGGEGGREQKTRKGGQLKIHPAEGISKKYVHLSLGAEILRCRDPGKHAMQMKECETACLSAFLKCAEEPIHKSWLFSLRGKNRQSTVYDISGKHTAKLLFEFQPSRD